MRLLSNRSQKGSHAGKYQACRLCTELDSTENPVTVHRQDCKDSFKVVINIGELFSGSLCLKFIYFPMMNVDSG